jgi:predicted nucleic acid-binding protein
MVYLDANVFVFAALATDKLGDASRHILANLRKIEAKTCCLTLDELAWAVLRRADVSTAAEACRAVLMLKDLEIISVEYGDVWEMTKMMETWKLKPRDGMHLAIMKRLGEESIVSEDEHFDKTNVKRIAIDVFANSI